jgi:hypothetical protein
MNSKVALLWDESFLWGLIAYKALKSNNLPFELIRSEDIRNGCLKNYKMLFVPGGWASNKLKAIGDKGVKEIKKFVSNGGSYLGFCGGAGLATLNGIGLLDIKRMPSKQRVPSFSGRIHLNAIEHAIWNGISRETEIQRYGNTENSPLHRFSDSPIHPFTHSPVFHAWWPSQFLVDNRNIRILATYGDALPDSFSSDLNVGDVKANGGWSELEEVYQINLNPERLKNEPAVVEGDFGKGKVVLSLIHFDTPDDENGAKVLKNLWEYLAGQSNRATEQQNSRTAKQQNIKGKIIPYENYCSTALLLYCTDIESAVNDLISLGIRNFLWFWRNPMLLQWRRGVRGLEYCTLYIMIKEIAEILKKQQSAVSPIRKSLSNRVSSQQSDLKKIKELLIPFTEKAKQLLVLERNAMQNGHITYEKCDIPEIQKIRTGLFGNSKSHGGLFKNLIDEVDRLLFSLIQ